MLGAGNHRGQLQLQAGQEAARGKQESSQQPLGSRHTCRVGSGGFSKVSPLWDVWTFLPPGPSHYSLLEQAYPT